MKTSFKKNQLIITALAVMIAIAGYLKYSDSMIDANQLTETSILSLAALALAAFSSRIFAVLSEGLI